MDNRNLTNKLKHPFVIPGEDPESSISSTMPTGKQVCRIYKTLLVA